MSSTTWGIVGYGVDVSEHAIPFNFEELASLSKETNDLPLTAEELMNMEGGLEFWCNALELTGRDELLRVCSDGGDKLYLYFPAIQGWSLEELHRHEDKGVYTDEDAKSYLLGFISEIMAGQDLELLQEISDQIDYISDGGMG